MSLEWLSWFVWAGFSLCGCLVSNMCVELWVLGFGFAALVAICLYETGLVAERWHENK